MEINNKTVVNFYENNKGW